MRGAGDFRVLSRRGCSVGTVHGSRRAGPHLLVDVEACQFLGAVVRRQDTRPGQYQAVHLPRQGAVSVVEQALVRPLPLHLPWTQSTVIVVGRAICCG